MRIPTEKNEAAAVPAMSKSAMRLCICFFVNAQQIRTSRRSLYIMRLSILGEKLLGHVHASRENLVFTTTNLAQDNIQNVLPREVHA